MTMTTTPTTLSRDELGQLEDAMDAAELRRWNCNDLVRSIENAAMDAIDAGKAGADVLSDLCINAYSKAEEANAAYYEAADRFHYQDAIAEA
jgi:hypothetical protein